jgi:hypothetical protein
VAFEANMLVKRVGSVLSAAPRTTEFATDSSGA